jgi:hypothetical protein
MAERPKGPWYADENWYQRQIRIDSVVYEARRDDGSGGSITYEADKPGSATQQRVIKDFFIAIRNCNPSFEINNSQLGGDPCTGARKKCTIYYYISRTSPLLCQTAFEYEAMNFKYHVIRILYGIGPRDLNQVNNSYVYRRFNRALRTAREHLIKNGSGSRTFADDAVEVSNENCGGDTAVDRKKFVRVFVQEEEGSGYAPTQFVDAQEGDKWPSLHELFAKRIAYGPKE